MLSPGGPEPLTSGLSAATAADGSSHSHWHTRAACAGIGPSMFFPAATGADGRHNGNVTGKAARRVCASCPVISECIADGMGETFGIWGGLSPAERLNRRDLPRIA